jgi:hypothetical protein
MDPSPREGIDFFVHRIDDLLGTATAIAGNAFRQPFAAELLFLDVAGFGDAVSAEYKQVARIQMAEPREYSESGNSPTTVPPACSNSYSPVSAFTTIGGTCPALM